MVGAGVFGIRGDTAAGGRHHWPSDMCICACLPRCCCCAAAPQIKLLKLLRLLAAGDKAASDNCAAVVAAALRRAASGGNHTIGHAIVYEAVRWV